jgi:hypothetical protein
MSGARRAAPLPRRVGTAIVITTRDRAHVRAGALDQVHAQGGGYALIDSQLVRRHLGESRHRVAGYPGFRNVSE